MPRKYSDEYLLKMAAGATSMINMMEQMNYRVHSGAVQTHLKQRLVAAGADLSHWRRGNTGKISNSRLPAVQVLVRIPGTSLARQSAEKLRRALQEVGVPYCCNIENCKVSTWCGQPLTLQVDHIDADWRNNEQSNLRFLCPNCHTQTETWGHVSRKASGGAR